MRFYKNLVPPILKTLENIFWKKMHAPQAVAQLLKSNRKWGSRDRRFLAEQVYECVRWYRLYYEIALGMEPQNRRDWWVLLGAAWVLQGHELPDWDEFKGLKPDFVLRRNSELHTQRAIFASIPDWLDKLCSEQLGEQKWTQTITALNEPAEVVLRANTLKAKREQVIEQLTSTGIYSHPHGLENAIVLEKQRKLTHLKSFQKGWFEIQDYSSQQVVPLLNPQAGSTVVDACAGAGGKTLQMAACMANQGRILAIDVEAKKLEQLEKRAKRAGVTIIEQQCWPDQAQVPEKLQGTADYVLIDAPCSGLGVLRRNPDAKWKLSQEFIEEMQRRQRFILGEYAKFCKPGGKLVYATCSILPAENEQQIAWFLEQTELGDEFSLLKQRTIYPQDEGFDGFFMALLERKSNS